MLDIAALKDLTSKSQYSRKDKLLFCLAAGDASPKKLSEILEVAKSAGLNAKDWHGSMVLTRAKGLAIHVNGVWELTSDGKRYVATLAGHVMAGPMPTVAAELRQHMAAIANAKIRAFVEEAVTCFETKQLRAATVLSWVGAVAVLYEQVLANKLAEFNTEAKVRNPKWKSAQNADDLALMGEFDFLQVCEKVSLIGKSVKHELETCLRFRNGCGHPNTLSIGPSRVSSHIESLILNVYSKY